MKKNIFLLVISVFLVGLASCSDDDKKAIVPSDIIDLSADTQNKPGYIVLRWETPDDNTIRYVKVTYYDYLLEKEVVRLASVYADSVLIPDTRKKFGEYEFKVQSFSESGDAGSLQTIKAVSEPAPIQVVYGDSKQIVLTEEQLSTNAQEGSEGPIKNLLDGDAATYFHSTWSASPLPPSPHWIQVDLGKEVTYFKYESIARSTAKDIPDDIDIMGSSDGVNFELIENLNKDKNGIPMSVTPFTSPVIGDNSKPYRYIRYSVNHTSGGSAFFSLSEFKIFEVAASIFDPEAE